MTLPMLLMAERTAAIWISTSEQSRPFSTIFLTDSRWPMARKAIEHGLGVLVDMRMRAVCVVMRMLVAVQVRLRLVMDVVRVMDMRDIVFVKIFMIVLHGRRSFRVILQSIARFAPVCYRNIS